MDYIESPDERITSIRLAEILKIPHKRIKQAIEDVECSAEFRECDYWLNHLFINNRSQECYRIGNDGLILLLMSLKGRKANCIKELILENYINYNIDPLDIPWDES